MTINMLDPHWLATNRAAVRLFMLAAACIVVAAVFGLITSIKIAEPGFALVGLPFQRLRPLHTFFSISAVISGLLALIAAITGSSQTSRTAMPRQLILMALFIGAGSLTLAAGITSGREYISWHPALSLLLFAAVFDAALQVVRARRVLLLRSAESLWLIGLGFLFILLGLIESHLWLLPDIGYNSVRDLTVQWHGLDVFFAGINAALYGCAIQVTSRQGKPLRARSLFLIATASMLFTFGHHHYVSPQPGFLKVLALVASLLAMVSFVRHLRTTQAMGEQSSPIAPLLKAVETWTLVAVGSGILMAIPYINTVLHGTYAVVIHAMGSMIGVNLMIVLAGGFAMLGKETLLRAGRIRFGVRVINYALTALWLGLTLIAVMEGLLRVNTDYLMISSKLRPMLYVFPVVGSALLFGLLFLCVELWRGCRAAINHISDESLTLRYKTEQE